MISSRMDIPAAAMSYKTIVEIFTGFPFEQLIDSLARPYLFSFRLTPAQAQVVLNAILSNDSKRFIPFRLLFRLDSVVINGSIKSFPVLRYL